MKLAITSVSLLATIVVVGAFAPIHHTFHRSQCSSTLFSSKTDAGDAAPPKPALTVGTLVEFSEKKRTHVGSIVDVQHKAKGGGARYTIEDTAGKRYDIADKAVAFAVAAPTNSAKKLLKQLEEAQHVNPGALQQKLDISSELLEMAWEETAADEDGPHKVTPKNLIELIHSKTASQVENYMAWRLLQTDMAHIFFKELKENGRVVAFKAKARKAVEAAKQAFCNSHAEEEICFV